MSWKMQSDEITEKDRKIIDGFYRAKTNLKQSGYKIDNFTPYVGKENTKRVCLICGGTMMGVKLNRKTCDKFDCKGKSTTYCNPNDYIHITRNDIEKQASEALLTMQKNDKWHDENTKTNNWKGEQYELK